MCGCSWCNPRTKPTDTPGRFRHQADPERRRNPLLTFWRTLWSCHCSGVVIWTEQIPTTICLGLMRCPGNHICCCIPLALMHTETESNPLCTTGCCPTDRHPGAVQRGGAGPGGRGYRFRPKPAVAIHDDAAARASEIRQASRRVHPRACTRLCRHFRIKPALLAQASSKRSPTPKIVEAKQRILLAGHGAARRGKPAKPVLASSASRGVDPKPSWRCF